MNPKGVSEWCDRGPGELGVLVASVALAEGYLDSPRHPVTWLWSDQTSVSASSFGRRSSMMMAPNFCDHVTQVPSFFVPGPPLYAMYKLYTYPVTLIWFEEHKAYIRNGKI